MAINQQSPQFGWREVLLLPVFHHDGVQVPVAFLHQHQHLVLGVCLAQLIVKGPHHQAALLQLLQEDNLPDKIVAHFYTLHCQVDHLEGVEPLVRVKHLEDGGVAAFADDPQRGELPAVHEELG